MEIGNLVFGNSRGEHPIPRGQGYEAPINDLFEAAGLDHYGHPESGGEGFDNGVFVVRPYWWGDCTCGYEERWVPLDARWCEDNKHADTCYQTELEERSEKWKLENGFEAVERAAFGDENRLIGAYDWEEEPIVIDGVTIGYTSMGAPRTDAAMEAWREMYERQQKFEQALYTELCRKYRKRKYGCAVHCTCDYEKRRAEWVATDGHAKDCRLVLPNFEHRASGLTVKWYKYPLRDSYMSAPYTLVEWARVMTNCRESLPGTA